MSVAAMKWRTRCYYHARHFRPVTPLFSFLPSGLGLAPRRSGCHHAMRPATSAAWWWPSKMPTAAPAHLSVRKCHSFRARAPSNGPGGLQTLAFPGVVLSQCLRRVQAAPAALGSRSIARGDREPVDDGGSSRLHCNTRSCDSPLLLPLLSM